MKQTKTKRNLQTSSIPSDEFFKIPSHQTETRSEYEPPELKSFLKVKSKNHVKELKNEAIGIQFAGCDITEGMQ